MAAQAGISGPGAVGTFAFEVVEELTDEACVQFFQGKFRRLLLQAFRSKAQEQPKGISISGDGLGAGLALPEETFREKAWISSGKSLCRVIV